MSLSNCFSPSTPCRCGFEGTGTHRCHAGRGTDEQCPREAKPKFVLIPSSLAGMQLKAGAVMACYCEECHAEAFPR
jgi:hypothetical protein